MRSLLAALGLTLFSPACDDVGDLAEPPHLEVTSPARSLIQNGTGQLTVTGVVGPNVHGSAVERVTVNGVAAPVQPDGSFSATAPRG